MILLDDWTYSLQVPHDPRGPRIARCTLRAVLSEHGLGELSHTAELLTSELTTNAFQHSDGPAFVRLSWAKERLRVSVSDNNPELPPPLGVMTTAADADHGRGLLLVERFADDWGGYALGLEEFGTRGKLVWFEIR